MRIMSVKLTCRAVSANFTLGKVDVKMLQGETLDIAALLKTSVAKAERAVHASDAVCVLIRQGKVDLDLSFESPAATSADSAPAEMPTKSRRNRDE